MLIWWHELSILLNHYYISGIVLGDKHFLFENYLCDILSLLFFLFLDVYCNREVISNSWKTCKHLLSNVFIFFLSVFWWYNKSKSQYWFIWFIPKYLNSIYIIQSRLACVSSWRCESCTYTTELWPRLFKCPNGFLGFLVKILVTAPYPFRMQLNWNKISHTNLRYFWWSVWIGTEKNTFFKSVDATYTFGFMSLWSFWQTPFWNVYSWQLVKVFQVKSHSVTTIFLVPSDNIWNKLISLWSSLDKNFFLI